MLQRRVPATAVEISPNAQGSLLVPCRTISLSRVQAVSHLNSAQPALVAAWSRGSPCWLQDLHQVHRPEILPVLPIWSRGKLSQISLRATVRGATVRGATVRGATVRGHNPKEFVGCCESLGRAERVDLSDLISGDTFHLLPGDHAGVQRPIGIDRGRGALLCASVFTRQC